MKFLSTICFILLTNLIFSQNTLSTIVKDSRRTAGPVPVRQGLFTINTSAARSTSVLGKHLHKYTPLRINATELKRVFNAHPQKLDLQLPIDGQPAELELVRTYLYAAGSKVFDSEGHEINYTPPVTYYGTVKGLPNSVVSVVVFEQDFVAMIADGKTSNAVITKDGLTDADRFIQYRDGDVKEANPIQCATPDKPLSGRELEEFRAKTQNRVLGNRSLGCIVMDVEFTHSTYTTYSNNSTNLLNWFNGVFAGVHTLYNNEQINLIMGATKINTSASEYGGGQYSTNPGTALDQFMLNAAGNSNFQGSFALVHLYEETADFLIQAIQQGLANCSHLPQQILNGVTTYVNLALYQPAMIHLLLVGGVGAVPALTVKRNLFRDKLIMVWQRPLDNALAQQFIPSQNTRRTAAGIVGGLDEILLSLLSMPNPETHASIAIQDMTQFALRAVGYTDQP